MTSRRILAALSLVCFIAPAHAQSYTKAQLSAQFTNNFPNQTVGAITPQTMVTQFNNVINSIMPTAPVTSGNLACFNGTTGLLQDCGVSLPLPLANGGLGGSQASATANQIPVYPGSGGAAVPTTVATTLAPIIPENGSTVTQGHTLCFLDQDCQYSGIYLGFVSAYPIQIGKSPCTVSGVASGQTYSVNFQWASNNITITYPASGTTSGSDTATTVANGLATLINANTTIHSATTGLPIFAQSIGSGNINIQWSYTITMLSSTPTPSTTGGGASFSCPAANLSNDYVPFQFGRTTAGKTLQTVENITALDFTGPDTGSSGALSTHYAQINVFAANTTSGSQQGTIQFNTPNNSQSPFARMKLQQGLTFWDGSGNLATAGDQGAGTINLPSSGGYYFAGLPVVGSAGLITPGNNVFGGIIANSTLNLQSTQSGSPSGDAVQITASGSVRAKWTSALTYNTTPLLVGASSTSITGCEGLFHEGTNENFCVTGPINLATGIGFLAVNDANNATVPIQFNASQFYLNGPLSVGTTTNPGSTNLLVAGSMLSNTAAGGVGYTTGSGGTVTQLTSRTTGVTLNNVTGAITLVSAAGSATPSTFTVTNSSVAATDTVKVVQKSGSNLYEIFVTAVAAGSFNITQFTTGGTTTESPVFNFTIIKGSAT